jgi:uncharacterized hydrophobic protein (TIGR00271 family)
MTYETDSLTDDAELEDLDEQAGLDLSRLDTSLLRNPVVARALAGIAVAVMVLAWPQRTDRILARLIGVALLVIASTSLWAAMRARPRRPLSAALGLVGILVAVALVASPDQSETLLARLVGAGLIVTAARDLGQRDQQSRAWIISRSLALIGAGALLLAFPTQVFSAVTTIAALGWIVLSALVIVVSLDPRTDGVTDYDEATHLIGSWLDQRPKSVDDRQALYDKILYEGPLTSRRMIRFFTLMGFASVIAAMGVITDSTAVVIGAMLIAPLMTPLMGMAISLVMGWPNRLARSSLVAVGGVGFSIAIGVVLGLIVPTVIDTATNGQITARSSPTTLDLITAIAAGAAGAYGLSRPDVSDSLPGVAIAISLVPPLSVVGIAYSQGDWSSGNGALLLFLTNAFAILVMGGVTFIATGVTPVRRVAENQHRVRSALAAVATLGAVIIGGLLLNGTQIATNLVEQSSIEATISDWLDGYPDHSLVRVTLDGDTITTTIVGPSAGAPTAQSVAADLRQALDRPITADVRLIVEERDIATIDT